MKHICVVCGSELKRTRDENRAGEKKVGNITFKLAQARWRCDTCGEWRPLSEGRNVKRRGA